MRIWLLLGFGIFVSASFMTASLNCFFESSSKTHYTLPGSNEPALTEDELLPSIDRPTFLEGLTKRLWRGEKTTHSMHASHSGIRGRCQWIVVDRNDSKWRSMHTWAGGPCTRNELFVSYANSPPQQARPRSISISIPGRVDRSKGWIEGPDRVRSRFARPDSDASQQRLRATDGPQGRARYISCPHHT